MRKILIFSMAYFPRVGGAEVAVKEITDRIKDIEFHMVTMRFSRDDAREEKLGNVFVHRVGWGGSRLNKFLFQFLAARRASALHAQHTFGAVWAIMAHSSGVPAALFKSSHPNVPLLLTLQEGDPPERIERTMLPLWPWFSQAFREADRVQAISNFLGAWARKRGFTGPLDIIPNGVDVARFSGRRAEHATTMLVTVSRLVPKNGIDTLIKALALLPSNIWLTIVGPGPQESELKRLARTLGVEDRILWLGLISQNELPAVLHRSDVFVRPSRSEGMGNAFIEAMAAGLPVVGTPVGGIPDFLRDGDTGFLAAPDDPHSVSEAISRALKHSSADVAARGRELAKQYDWDKIAADMRLRFFGSVLVQ